MGASPVAAAGPFTRGCNFREASLSAAGAAAAAGCRSVPRCPSDGADAGLEFAFLRLDER